MTDYSSIFIDYANLKRPLIFYMYDYDLYKGTNSNTVTKENSIFGDSTWETMGWYSNYAYIISAWAVRGGSYLDTNNAGIFYFGTNGGGATSYSSRTTLIP